MSGAAHRFEGAKHLVHELAGPLPVAGLIGLLRGVQAWEQPLHWSALAPADLPQALHEQQTVRDRFFLSRRWHAYRTSGAIRDEPARVIGHLLERLCGG